MSVPQAAIDYCRELIQEVNLELAITMTARKFDCSKDLLFHFFNKGKER